MNRRLVLMSALTVPFIAEGLASRAAAQAMAPAAGPLDAMQHKHMTLMIGTLSKQISELAMQRARDPKVKEFAGFETAEQTTIAQVLNDALNPPPAPLPPNLAATMERLQKMQEGAAFDRAYVAAEIEGHDHLLGVQQRYLQSEPGISSDGAHVAMLARTVIQMHLTMLHDLQHQLAA